MTESNANALQDWFLETLIKSNLCDTLTVANAKDLATLLTGEFAAVLWQTEDEYERDNQPVTGEKYQVVRAFRRILYRKFGMKIEYPPPNKKRP